MAAALAQLRAARAAVERGDHGAARDALVVAWRSSRAPALAALVDVLDPRAPDALSAQLAAVVTPRVVSSLANLRALAKVDDPRLATWVLAALANPPFCAATAEPFLMLLATTIERLRDPRLDAALPAIRGVLTARITRKPVYTRVLKKLDTAVAKRPTLLPAPAKAERALHDELAAVIAPLHQPARTVESLLAEVYARPDDDAPRMVLADLLLERGDPRGELIMLQLARGRGGEPGDRERELLKKHGRAWLGPLASVLSFGKGYSGTEFRRGFIAKADFIFKVEKKLRLVARDPAWATVEELEGPWDRALLEHAPLRALREVSLGETSFVAVARRTEPLPAVTSIAVHRSIDIQVELAGSTAALLRRLFPALARIELSTLADLTALATLGVRELVIDLYCAQESIAARRREHAAFVARLPHTRAVIERVSIRAPWYDWNHKPELVTYVRGPAGTYVVQA